MTENVNEGEPPSGEEPQKAKASGLNNSVLGGFARTTAKRFAEYKTSAKDNDGKTSSVATAPTNRHSRHDWLERLFDLFEQYAVEVNKLVEESHLITTCHRPSEEPSDNPLISAMQGCVSTKYWQLTVRLQADGIAGYLLPMSMEKTFLRDESLFERIFLIESPGDDNAAVWSFDNKPTEFFQLPDLAKRFFGSLIEIARMEDISDFEEMPLPVTAVVNTQLPPIPSFEVEESATVDEAKFKDLLNYASNVASNAVPEADVHVHTAAEAAAPSASPFAALSEPTLDLAKLEEQAESVRKKNKASSSDFATKTLDSYALLDFEDAETYYSEYRLTPAPESAVPPAVPVTESLFTRESIPPQDLDEDTTFASAALVAAAESARINVVQAEAHAAALAEVARAEAALAAEHAATKAEEERAEAERVESERLEFERIEESRAEEARAEEARAEEARAEEARAEEARAEEARAEEARAEEARAEEASAEEARAEEARAEEARAEEARAEEARAEEARAEEARAEEVKAEEAKAEEAKAELAHAEAAATMPGESDTEKPVESAKQTDATADAKRAEAARVEALIARASAKSPFADPSFKPVPPVTWDSAPVSWEHQAPTVEEVQPTDNHAAEAPPEHFPLSTSNLEGERIPSSGTVLGEPVPSEPATGDAKSPEMHLSIPTPIITRVPAQNFDDTAPDLVPPVDSPVNSTSAALDDEDQRATFTQRAEDMHGYRKDDTFDLLTPSDVELSAQTLDPSQDDKEIADALLAVTNPSDAPVIKESLSRRELSSEVKKLAAKLQQTSSDLIDTFSRKAQELSANASDKRSNATTPPVTITPVTPASSFTASTESKAFEVSADLSGKDSLPKQPANEAVDADGWRVFAPDESPLLKPIDNTEPLLSIPADDEFLLSSSELELEPELMADTSGQIHDQVIRSDIESPREEQSTPAFAQEQVTNLSEEEFNDTFLEAQKFASSVSDNENANLQPVAQFADESTVDAEIVESQQALTHQPEITTIEHESARLAEHDHARETEEFISPEAELSPASEVSPAPISHGEQHAEHAEHAEATEQEAPIEAPASVIESGAAPEVVAETEPTEETQTDAEKLTAFSETFRRSNQTASKKFIPYSSTAAESTEQEPTQSDSLSETAAEASPKTFFESLQSNASRRILNQINEQQETVNNSQEISMPKTDEMSVIAAIEMMRHSVERELESVAEVGAHAFQAQDMDIVERAMKRTRRVKEFKDQLLPALEAWNNLGREDI